MPNFAAFYVTWRAWSHWKAWKGAEWLNELIEKDRVEVKEDEDFGRVLRVLPGEGEGGKGAAAGHGGGKDHAPDETATPKMAPGGMEEVQGENAIQKTEALTGKSVRTSGSEPLSNESKEATPASSKASESSSPDPKSEDVAPDTTSTPSSQIFTPSDSSSTTTSQSAEPTYISSKTLDSEFAGSEDDIHLTAENLPRLAKQFGLSPAEIVDLTRAVMQMKDRVRKAEEDGQNSASQ